MREILFRGKRLDNGEWALGYVGVFKGTTQIYVPFTAEEEKENEGHIFSVIGGLWHTVIPETIGQFTGLTDKNGKVIFEGDIVVFNRGRNLRNSRPHPEVIFFDERNVQFTRYTSPYATLQKDMMNECEVIGNIHDNPELVEVN